MPLTPASAAASSALPVKTDVRSRTASRVRVSSSAKVGSGVEDDDHPVLEGPEPLDERVARPPHEGVAADADEVAGLGLARRERLDADVPLGALRRDERALGAGLDEDDAHPGVEVGQARGGQADALGVEGRLDQVPVRPRADRPGMDALRAGPGRREEDRHGAPGVEAVRRRHDVATTGRQRGHLHHRVDERLRGVDDPGHAAEYAGGAAQTRARTAYSSGKKVRSSARRRKSTPLEPPVPCRMPMVRETTWR